MELQQDIFVNNAGLVILNSYFSVFFKRCGFMDENGFLSPALAPRAALALQYVFDPGGTFLEEDLVLNKLICGLAIAEILEADFVVNEVEVETTESMIAAIISHWTQISNSSEEGFREPWLHREGKLSEKENEWELIVEQRAYDILLDHIPFSINPVNFAWMKKPIKVNWR